MPQTTTLLSPRPPDPPFADHIYYLGTALSALVLGLVIARWGGYLYAWDSALYFQLGLPLMAGGVFFCAYRVPHRPWRWAVSTAAGQAMALLIQGVGLHVLPLSLAVLMALSIPLFVAGLLGARLARRNGVP